MAKGKNILYYLGTFSAVVFLAYFISTGLSIVLAQWTDPGASPTAGNTEPPITISGTGQVKTGGLGTGVLDVQGGIYVSRGAPPFIYFRKAGVNVGQIRAQTDTRIGITGPSGAAADEVFSVMTNTGNVGIGITDPIWPLVINRPNGGIQIIRGGGAPFIMFTNAATTVGQIRGPNDANGPRVSITNAGGVNEYLVVNTVSGNVGIGTNAPSHTLDVAGQIRSQTGYVFPDGRVSTTRFPMPDYESGWQDLPPAAGQLDLTHALGTQDYIVYAEGRVVAPLTGQQLGGILRYESIGWWIKPQMNVADPTWHLNTIVLGRNDPSDSRLLQVKVFLWRW